MNVTMTKRTLKGMAPRHSMLLRGRHGIGKSEVVRQCALELSAQTGRAYEFIDIRLSQREPGDVIGMPRTLSMYPFTRTVYKGGLAVQETVEIPNVMVHDLPVWFPRDPDSFGFLFLDELDRATREVQQTGFEISLDYTLNLNPLPMGWRVVSAANADQDIYAVLDIDPALLSRFFVNDFKPTVPEWMDHALTIGVHPAIIQYITKVPLDLDTPEQMDPGKVYPCRRSWVMLSNNIKHMTENGDNPIKDLDYLTLLAKGYVGNTVAVNFVEFVSKDFDVLSVEDILNNPSKTEATLSKVTNPAEATFYCDLVARHFKEGNTIKAKQNDNLFTFLKALPKESASRMWTDLLNANRPEAVKWSRSNKAIGEYLFSLVQK